MNKIRLLIVAILICCGSSLEAQHVSVSTNLLDWAALGGANLSAGVSVSRHFSLEVGGVYNPYSFTKESGLKVRNQQKTGFLAVKYWPWYVFSGWWVSAKAQYSDYSRTGTWRIAMEDGKAIGGGLSAGYTLMISRKLNLDIGAGLWGGKKNDYYLYHCTNCMQIREEGSRLFIAPDKITLSLMYVF